jgi:hypothetical protein
MFSNLAVRDHAIESADKRLYSASDSYFLRFLRPVCLKPNA